MVAFHILMGRWISTDAYLLRLSWKYSYRQCIPFYFPKTGKRKVELAGSESQLPAPSSLKQRYFKHPALPPLGHTRQTMGAQGTDPETKPKVPEGVVSNPQEVVSSPLTSRQDTHPWYFLKILAKYIYSLPFQPLLSIQFVTSLEAQQSRTCLPMQQMLVQSLGWEDPLEKEMVSLPGESHKQRNQAGYSPWAWKRDKHDLVTKQQQSVQFSGIKYTDTALQPLPPSISTTFSSSQAETLYLLKKHFRFLRPPLSAWHLPSTSCLNKCDYSRHLTKCN